MNPEKSPLFNFAIIAIPVFAMSLFWLLATRQIDIAPFAIKGGFAFGFPLMVGTLVSVFTWLTLRETHQRLVSGVVAAITVFIVVWMLLPIYQNSLRTRAHVSQDMAAGQTGPPR